MTTFNSVADQINHLFGSVEWNSLGMILKHQNTQKTNDDGSLDVQMFGNQLILANNSTEIQVYHVYKKETLNIPIEDVLVNGKPFLYLVQNETLLLNVLIPSRQSIEIYIDYGESGY